MDPALRPLIDAYDPRLPLELARTIPSAWYLDPRIGELERRTVFSVNWQCVARIDQLDTAGCYITAEVAGEPIIVVRGDDGRLRAFFNVCRHHAAAVCTELAGSSRVLRCPYHGWTYTLAGALKGVPEFDGVQEFDRTANGLLPIACETWEQFVFVRLAPQGPSLAEFLGPMAEGVAPLQTGRFQFAERRTYDLNCNWKVFVDNYLDGGYHVPHIHAALGSVLNYAEYTIECGPRFCLQSSPIQAGDAAATAVRQGDRAHYYWLHPNLMLNIYADTMDTNLVLPLGVDRCRVVFDFFFSPSRDAAWRGESVRVADVVQQEDVAVCESVQRGLGSRAYDVGRLSVRREAGEHLFHRLLYADLRAGFNPA